MLIVTPRRARDYSLDSWLFLHFRPQADAHPPPAKSVELSGTLVRYCLECSPWRQKSGSRVKSEEVRGFRCSSRHVEIPSASTNARADGPGDTRSDAHR